MQCRNGVWAIVFLPALFISGCGTTVVSSTDSGTAAATDAIAVSSPYLEAVVRDLLPRQVSVVRLAGPSMCPGHFDLQPSKIVELARSRLLVRFDFQNALDQKIAARTQKSMDVSSVEISGGLCEPDSYLAACRQVADRLVSIGELAPSDAQDRLNSISERMRALTEEAHRKVEAAGLRGLPVLTSGHQAAFCRWLGLRTAASFSAGDVAGTGQIDDAVKAGETEGVKIIVANDPEGRQLADALADRINARVVVFANFPQPDSPEAFDSLVRRNVAALLETQPP